jgi:hypothetical protein
MKISGEWNRENFVEKRQKDHWGEISSGRMLNP